MVFHGVPPHPTRGVESLAELTVLTMSQPDPKKPKMSSLEQLKASGTVVVADTGDFEAIAKFQPRWQAGLVVCCP